MRWKFFFSSISWYFKPILWQIISFCTEEILLRIGYTYSRNDNDNSIQTNSKLVVAWFFSQPKKKKYSPFYPISPCQKQALVVVVYEFNIQYIFCYAAFGAAKSEYAIRFSFQNVDLKSIYLMKKKKLKKSHEKKVFVKLIRIFH